MKRKIRWSALLLLLCVILASCGAQEPPAGAAETGTVALTVTCQDAVQQGGLSQDILETLPTDGVLLSERAYPISEGMTALAVLQEALRAQNISIEIKDGYVNGIHSLRAGDCGDTSGWLFRVNGVLPSVGAGEYVLQPGDTVEWLYICDMNAFFEENGITF